MKTVVLTSRENLVWHSMQEIIPSIERAWMRSATPGEHEVVCLNIDDTPLSALMPELILADNIVQTCFTHKMCRYSAIARKELGVEGRWIIHLHNQATIGCWPFYAWGMGEHLLEDDIFISSCTRDAETAQLSFERAQVEMIPFSNPEQESLNKGLRPPEPSFPIPFLFIGRISSQKNIHTLLYAFRLWLDKHRGATARLELFGKEDNLGSPNMGLGSDDYKERLQEITRTLNMEGAVSFRGHQEREALCREVFSRKHILVSPSLHSDENFGMAAFRSLSAGHLAILSDWGGHSDLKHHFAKQVFLAQVRRSLAGPFICPSELAGLLEQAVRQYEEPTLPLFPETHTEHRVAMQLRATALKPRKARNPLRQTVLAQRLLSKRAFFARNNPRSTQIFDSYFDPDSALFFERYGMASTQTPLGPTKGKYQLLPWVRLTREGLFSSDDPHRGSLFAKTEADALALGFLHEPVEADS